MAYILTLGDFAWSTSKGMLEILSRHSSCDLILVNVSSTYQGIFASSYQICYETYRVVQPLPARLCELATMLGVSTHNLAADTFLDNPVHTELMIMNVF